MSKSGAILVNGVKDHLAYAEQHLRDLGLDKEWMAVLPQQNELFIDYDVPDAQVNWDNFFKIKQIFDQRWKTPSTFTKTVSRSGNTHVIVKAEGYMDVVERIGWQAAFGSDPIRESLSMMAYKTGQANVILFFERRPAPTVVNKVVTILDAVGRKFK